MRVCQHVETRRVAYARQYCIRPPKHNKREPEVAEDDPQLFVTKRKVAFWYVLTYS